MQCPKCQADNPEQAKFCISCGTALPRICPNCGASNPPNARFCNQCGTPLQSQPSAGASRADLPATPAATRAQGGDADIHHEADEPEEERRIVTVLFADLTSSTSLAEDMDPEETRALLGAFFQTMARAIHRHGGTVEKYIGDAVMAVFGLPFTHEDDPLRAVRAALDMQQALRAFNAERRAEDPTAPELHMRIGINTGEVAAASDAVERGDFLITGDPVNVSARLQQLAQPGDVLVGPRTYRATQGAVEYAPPLQVTLRGRSRPIRIWKAQGLSGESAAPIPRPRGLQGVRTPLVGRDIELGILNAIYQRVAHERRPHLVTLLGNPGIGKTRLAREFLSRLLGMPLYSTSTAQTIAPPELARASGPLLGERETQAIATTAASASTPHIQGGLPRVLEGRCPPYGEGITYWPLAEMLRAYCGITPQESPQSARGKILASVTRLMGRYARSEDPETLAAYLGATVGIESRERRRALLPSDPNQLQEGLFRAWRTFFEMIATPRSLILFIEDIHWADDVFLDLLEDLAAHVTNASLLILCTARPELLEKRAEWGGGRRNYATIALEALSEGETQTLLRALLPGEDIPLRLRKRILDQAEGNPFYIEEIVRMLVDRGILTRESEDAYSWEIAPQYIGSEELSEPAIPDSIQGVIGARLDLLRPEERDVLQHAAVIGRYFWPSALLHLAPHLEAQRLANVLAALEAKDLIRVSEHGKISVAPANEPVYTFNHSLTREVVYSTIVRSRRAHEHLRVAEWLEQLAQGREAEYADLLARHLLQYYVQANLARSRNTARRQSVLAKVVQALAFAGDQAAARRSAGKAEDYYTEALHLLEEDAAPATLTTRMDLLTKRGDVRWMALRGDDAWADYQSALVLWSRGIVLPTPVAAGGESLTTSQLASAAPPVVPLDWAPRGLRLYQLLVQLPSRFSSYFQQVPPNDELLRYLNEGLFLADQLGQQNTSAYAALLTAKSFLWWSWYERRGEQELLDALRSAREAVRITEALGDSRGASEALDALGNIQAITTDLRGYLESQTRRLQLAQQIDDASELVDMYAEVSQAYQMVGEYDRAAQYAHIALERANAADSDQLRVHALRSQVLTYFEWDRWDETLSSGGVLLDYATRTRARPRFVQWILLAMAIVHARRGELDASDALARRAAETQSSIEAQYIEVYRARLALAQNASREARQLLLSALDARAGRHSLAMLLAELAELAALTDDAELYDRFGAQALELGWRSGARKPLAQAMRARAIFSQAHGHVEDALSDAQNALGRFSSLGTIWEEARTRSVLAGLYRRRNAEGDAALADAELRQAREVFAALRAVQDLARIRTALAGDGLRLS